MGDPAGLKKGGKTRAAAAKLGEMGEKEEEKNEKIRENTCVQNMGFSTLFGEGKL